MPPNVIVPHEHVATRRLLTARDIVRLYRPNTQKAMLFQQFPGQPKKPVAVDTMTVGQVGNAPDGMGKSITWDRKDKTLMLAWINAADDLGILIEGFHKGDSITFLSGSGNCSFAEDKGNPVFESLIGLAAIGAEAVAATQGHPELVPLIEEAGNELKKQCAPTGEAEKVRDVFGRDPGFQHARQEGGILIMLPGSLGPAYSSTNEAYWIGKNGGGVRYDSNRPPQVENGFFPYERKDGHNGPRYAGGDGSLFMLAWDVAGKFVDNRGVYRVELLLEPTGHA
jgi:hypothetical protein